MLSSRSCPLRVHVSHEGEQRPGLTYNTPAPRRLSQSLRTPLHVSFGLPNVPTHSASDGCSGTGCRQHRRCHNPLRCSNDVSSPQSVDSEPSTTSPFSFSAMNTAQERMRRNASPSSSVNSVDSMYKLDTATMSFDLTYEDEKCPVFYDRDGDIIRTMCCDYGFRSGESASVFAYVALKAIDACCQIIVALCAAQTYLLFIGCHTMNVLAGAQTAERNARCCSV